MIEFLAEFDQPQLASVYEKVVNVYTIYYLYPNPIPIVCVLLNLTCPDQFGDINKCN